MFNSVYMDEDKKKGSVTFRGWFGVSFKNVVATKYLPLRKVKSLFIDIRSDVITVDNFFLLELYYLVKEMVNSKSNLSVNKKSLDNLKTILEESTWVKDVVNETIVTTTALDYGRIKEKFNYQILPHQEPAYEEYEKMKMKLGYKGYLLYGKPGVGKTFISLSIAEALHSELVIIVCPLPTVDKVWKHSIEEELYKEPQSTYTSLDYGKKDYDGEKFIIFHYDALDKLDKLVKDIKHTKTTILIDESHNFNELKSKRTNQLLSITEHVDSNDVLLLSGTPVKAKINELLPMLKILDGKLTKHVEKRFIELYKSPNWLLAKILPIRYGNYIAKVEKSDMGVPPMTKEDITIKLKNGKDYTLKAIKEQIKSYVEDRGAEILHNLPKYQERYDYLYNRVKNELIAKGTKAYLFQDYEEAIKKIQHNYDRNTLGFIPETIVEANKFEKSYILPELSGDEKKEFKDIKSIVKYPRLKIQGEVLGRIVLRARINAHRDIAKALDYKTILNSTTKKTLIFTNYVDIAETVTNTSSRLGFTPIGVYGNTTADLARIVTNFTENSKINPLVATYASLSTGVPIVAANVMVAIDLPYREYIFNQAIARLWRLGQDKPVTVYITRLDTGDEKNINDRNVDIIAWYKKEVEKITGISSGLEIDYNTTTDEVSNEDLSLGLLEALKGTNIHEVSLDTTVKIKKDITDTW